MNKILMTVMAGVALSAFAGGNESNPFGPNVRIFSPSDPIDKVDAEIEGIFKQQHHRQFGPERYAFLFKPGDYTNLKTINVGYYTQVLGLGRSPLDVKLSNVKTPAALEKNNATCNFWVGIENLSIADKDNNADPFFNFQWAVSQAAPARRLYVERKAVFDWFYGWASGGYVADCIFKKQAGSYSQQQYYSRNSHIAQGTYGINWNNVIQGCTGPIVPGVEGKGKDLKACAPISGKGIVSNWKTGGNATVIESTEVIREKPFLFLDNDAWKVCVPALRRNATGPSWSETNPGDGKVLDLAKDFYVAREDRDTAKTINAQLAKGKHILFAPGIFKVAEPIRVTKPGTILLGIGEATLVPMNDDAALRCADVDGLIIAGLIFDAVRPSRRFVVMGDRKTAVRHVDNPSILQDCVYRVGGTGEPGKTEVCVEINSNDLIIDHTWVWRADHGEHTGWTANTSKNGILVNGDEVIGYGLFVEHFQEHDILWNGENGRTYFLQNEKCYDPQGNEVWMSHGGKKKGWAAYKVADHVKRHYAVGLGVYDVFINTNGHTVQLDDAIEVPKVPGVTIENACIVELANGEGPIVGINHICNGEGFGIRTGKGSGGGYAVQRLVKYNGGKAEVLGDYYKARH